MATVTVSPGSGIEPQLDNRLASSATRRTRKLVARRRGWVVMWLARWVWSSGLALRDVVLHRDRLALGHERTHACLEFLVGQRGAAALVQVVGPAGDDEALAVARRVAEVAIDAPEGGAVAASRGAQLAQRVEERRCIVGADSVGDLHRHRASLRVGLVRDEP